jgi:hypothetical protein
VLDVARFLADPARAPVTDFAAWAESHAAEGLLGDLEHKLAQLARELPARSDSAAVGAVLMVEAAREAIATCREALAAGNAAAAALAMHDATSSSRSAEFALHQHLDWLQGKRKNDTLKYVRSLGGKARAAPFKERNARIESTARVALSSGLGVGKTVEKIRNELQNPPSENVVRRIVGRVNERLKRIR